MTNHHHLNARKQQKGQMSIELAIVVAIVVLILAGIIYYTTQGRKGTKLNSEASAMTAIVGATQKLYNADPNGYANVAAQDLINNGVIPASMVVAGAITSGFGTPITVAPATLYNAGDGVAFSEAVSPDDCSAYVQAVASDFAKITVAGTAVKDSTANQALTAATLGTQCSGTNGANVPLVLTASR